MFQVAAKPQVKDLRSTDLTTFVSHWDFQFQSDDSHQSKTHHPQIHTLNHLGIASKGAVLNQNWMKNITNQFLVGELDLI
jgi:hypothetical protein